MLQGRREGREGEQSLLSCASILCPKGSTRPVRTLQDERKRSLHDLDFADDGSSPDKSLLRDAAGVLLHPWHQAFQLPLFWQLTQQVGNACIRPYSTEMR